MILKLMFIRMNARNYMASSHKATIGKTEAGKDLAIDVPKLLATRMLLDAESGGGKTVALKRMLEQTHGHVQQIVIDPEGEFSTLREKFDYLLCAPEGADAIANPKTAAILARKLRETRVSAVIDIYDLRPAEQRLFVRLFVEELLAAPKNLWNPCLVVIDEAQIFAPEQGEAESLGAIMDLRGRGRKRGLCLILATPRLAQLSKDACAGLQNKLIGVTTLDLDVKRAARDLSMSPTEATTLLRNLEPGEFYCFGPALTRTITKIKVGHIQTKHGQHAVGKDTRPPAPSEKIKDVIAKLTDLPKEAEQEARTLADLKRENTNLKRELTLAKKAQPRQSATEIKKIPTPVVGKRATKAIQDAAAKMRKMAKSVSDSATLCLDATKAIESAVSGLETKLEQVTKQANTETAATDKSLVQYRQPIPFTRANTSYLRRAGLTSTPPAVGEINLTPMDRAILTVLAQVEEGCRAQKLVLLAGYTLNGSTRNSFSKLRTAGLVVGGNTEIMNITKEGLEALGPYDPLPIEGRGLVNYWLNHKMLTPMDRSILTALITNPDGLDAEPLCVDAGYTLNGSTRNSFSKLRTAGLIVGKNTETMRASEELLA